MILSSPHPFALSQNRWGSRRGREFSPEGCSVDLQELCWENLHVLGLFWRHLRSEGQSETAQRFLGNARKGFNFAVNSGSPTPQLKERSLLFFSCKQFHRDSSDSRECAEKAVTSSARTLLNISIIWTSEVFHRNSAGLSSHLVGRPGVGCDYGHTAKS